MSRGAIIRSVQLQNVYVAADSLIGPSLDGQSQVRHKIAQSYKLKNFNTTKTILYITLSNSASKTS